MRSWIRSQVSAFRSVPPPVALLAAAGVALFLAFWVRTTAWGVTAHMLIAPIEGEVDVLAIGPSDPIPPDREAGTYVSPLHDPQALWQVGHMVDAWTRKGLPIEVVPPAHIVYRGRMKVPDTGTWRIGPPDGSADMSFWIDGERMPPEGRRLTAGWHDVQFNLRHTDIKPFVIQRSRNGSPPAPTPVHHLIPESGVPAATWILAALGAVLAIAGAALARDPGVRASSVASGRAWAPVLVVVLAMLAGTMLRSHARLVAPRIAHTWDEYQEAWQGYSLLSGEKPLAWGFPPWAEAYRRTPGRVQVRNFFGRQMLIVQPYTEHPPLFALLVGLSAKIAGVTDVFRIPLAEIRRVPMLLSLFFYPLLYAIGRRTIGRGPAAVACLFFAVCPPFVLVMRYAKGDLLVALLSLVSVWAGLCFREEADPRGRRATVWLVACGVAAGLGFWAKELGIYALTIPGLVLAPVAVQRAEEDPQQLARRLRPALIATGIALAVLLLYLAYGAAVGWERFLAFLKIQGATRIGRFDVGVDAVDRQFLNWAAQTLYMFKGGWILLWLTAIWSASRGKARLFGAIVFVYLAALVAALDGRWLYGWYQLPLYAPMALLAAPFFWRVGRRPGVAMPIAVLVLGVLPLLGQLWTVPDAEKMRMLRLCILVGAAPFGFAAVIRAAWADRAARWAGIGLVVVFFGVCALMSWRIDYFYALTG